MSEVYGRVYCVLNLVNGKRYIGKTIGAIKKRWQGHVKDARTERRRSPLQLAIRKYGAESFTITAVESARSISELDEAEQKWIADLGTLAPAGYNLRHGGDGGHHHETTKPKLAAASKRFWADPKNRKMMCERLASPEVKARKRECWSDPNHRKNISAKSKASWSDENIRAARVKAHKEVWTDPAHRLKVAKGQKAARQTMSEAAKRHWADPECRARMVAAQRMARSLESDRKQKSIIQKLKWQDPVYRERQRAAILTRSLPSDFRETMSASMKALWARRKEKGKCHRNR